MIEQNLRNELEKLYEKYPEYFFVVFKKDTMAVDIFKGDRKLV